MTTATFTPSTEQQQVIAHRGGHLQVIACAGAGKTEAIARRVCSLIEEGVEPGQVVAFTFTERAAASLKNRITRRVAESKGDDFLDKLGAMYVGTIHAFCLKLLQDHVPDYGNCDVLDENRLAGLLSREYKRLDLNRLGGQHWRPIHDVVRNADVVENELIDRRTLLGTPFGDCYNDFCKTLSTSWADRSELPPTGKRASWRLLLPQKSFRTSTSDFMTPGSEVGRHPRSLD